MLQFDASSSRSRVTALCGVALAESGRGRNPCQRRHFREKAKLIVEVLSENTERADREGKFAFYRQLDTLDEYVLIAQDSRRVEIYRRSNRWRPEFYTGDASIQIESVGLPLTLDQVYEGVSLG